MFRKKVIVKEIVDANSMKELEKYIEAANLLKIPFNIKSEDIGSQEVFILNYRFSIILKAE